MRAPLRQPLFLGEFVIVGMVPLIGGEGGLYVRIAVEIVEQGEQTGDLAGGATTKLVALAGIACARQ